MESFHFLRPWMLLLLLPVCVLLFAEYQRGLVRSSWQRVVDAHLLSFQLGDQQRKSRIGILVMMFVAALLISLALAGPVWEQRPLPVFRDQLARVIVLDVSRSMDAADVEPSRIARARFKARDLLSRSQGIQVGLIAFGAVPYVISPLTDDTRTIAAMIPSLSTSIVPVQGSDVSTALQEAATLMRGAGVKSGEVVLITDATPTSVDLAGAAALRANGYVLSVLAVGSEAGAPIPDRSNFLKDSAGNIVIASLKVHALRELAQSGGGQFAQLSADEADISTLLKTDPLTTSAEKRTADNKQTDSWVERGPWLLLPLIPYVAFLFRRGAI